MRLIFIQIIFLFIILSCQNSQDSKSIIINKSINKDTLAFDSTSYQAGKIAFSNYCKNCHIPPHWKHGHNYHFDNLFQKMPSEDYFISYLENTKALRDSGDFYAIKNAKEWGIEYNHNYKDSIKNFNSLIYYIKEGVKIKNAR